MKAMLLVAALLAVPAIGHAQDIANPTCAQAEQMAVSLGAAARPWLLANLTRDWRKLDTIQIPGQGPMTDFILGHIGRYGTLVDIACTHDESEPLADAAGAVHLQARIDLYGGLP